MTPKPFPYLFPHEYEHPFDKQALNRLENTRGLKMLSRRVLDHGLEKYLLLEHTGDNIRITKRSIPELHDLLEQACDILGVREIPELYIKLEDKITSITSGEKRRLIVISTGCVELLSNEEILFMLGREIGHIKSNHVLYHMMAHSIRAISQFISDLSLGIGNLLSLPLQMALLHWHRMSEFSADRAGLLACQDEEVAARALIKIAGYPLPYMDRINLEDFREQAAEFDKLEETNIDKIIRFAASHENYQPFTVIRAAELFKWINEDHYEAVLHKDRADKEKILSNACGNRACPYPFGEDERFCQECGIPLKV